MNPVQVVDALRTIAICVLGFTELLRDAEISDGDRQVYLGVLDGACDASDALPKRPA